MESSERRFGKLVVLEEITKKGSGNRLKHLVKVQCDCGVIIELGKGDVLSGHRTSCGCNKRPMDIIGKQFGQLTVLKRVRYPGKNGHYRHMAICRCTCGNIKEVFVQALTRKDTTSCGCRRDQYKKLLGSNNPKYVGYQGISGIIWTRYRSGAKTREIPFLLTIEEAWEIFESQGRKCALTSIPLVFSTNRKDQSTASLDRIDNSRGYVKDNVQWVHKNINMMRGPFSIEHFTEICLLVARENGWAPHKEFQWSEEPHVSTLGEIESRTRHRQMMAEPSELTKLTEPTKND